MDVLGVICRVPSKIGAEAPGGVEHIPDAKPPPSMEDRAISVLRIAGYIAAPIAVGVSYSRNQSGPWAIAHGLIGLPYLVYVGAEKLTKSGER
jgi:hypothetical protein